MAESKIPQSTTTMRLKISTRDMLKSTADRKNVSMEDMILRLMQKDITKQILITVDNKNYDMMMHMAKLLKNTGYTDSDRLSDMMLWCFSYMMKEVQSHIDTRIQSPAQPNTQQGMYGQPQGGRTV